MTVFQGFRLSISESPVINIITGSNTEIRSGYIKIFFQNLAGVNLGSEKTQFNIIAGQGIKIQIPATMVKSGEIPEYYIIGYSSTGNDNTFIQFAKIKALNNNGELLPLPASVDITTNNGFIPNLTSVSYLQLPNDVPLGKVALDLDTGTYFQKELTEWIPFWKGSFLIECFSVDNTGGFLQDALSLDIYTEEITYQGNGQFSRNFYIGYLNDSAFEIPQATLIGLAVLINGIPSNSLAGRLEIRLKGYMPLETGLLDVAPATGYPTLIWTGEKDSGFVLPTDLPNQSIALFIIRFSYSDSELSIVNPNATIALDLFLYNDGSVSADYGSLTGDYITELGNKLEVTPNVGLSVNINSGQLLINRRISQLKQPQIVSGLIADTSNQLLITDVELNARIEQFGYFKNIREAILAIISTKFYEHISSITKNIVLSAIGGIQLDLINYINECKIKSDYFDRYIAGKTSIFNVEKINVYLVKGETIYKYSTNALLSNTQTIIINTIPVIVTELPVNTSDTLALYELNDFSVSSATGTIPSGTYNLYVSYEWSGNSVSKIQMRSSALTIKKLNNFTNLLTPSPIYDSFRLKEYSFDQETADNEIVLYNKNNQLYRRKENNSTPELFENINVSFGITVPDNNTGSNKDLYIKTNDGIIYQKDNNNIWVNKINLVTDTEVSNLFASHLIDVDPHPVYLTQQEGSNLYALNSTFNENVDDRVSVLLRQGNNISIVYDDTNNTLTINAIVPTSAGGGSGLKYVYKTSTGNTNLGEIKGDLTSNSISINPTDNQDNIQTNLLNKLKIGTIFEIRKDLNNWVQFTITSNYNNGLLEVNNNIIEGIINNDEVVYLSILSDAPSFAGKLIASTLIAYGDSVTVGTGASTTAQGYAVLVSQAAGWALTNNAVGSTGITDASDLILAAAPSDTTQFILAFGLNDLSYHQSSSNGQSIFVDALAASIAWLGIRAGERSKGQSTNIAYAGTWTNSANYGGGIAKAGVATATAIFNFNGSALLIGYSRLATATATFTVSIDGGAATVVAGVNAAASRAGRNFSPCLHTISGLSDTDHTVVITISTGTLELIYLAGIGSETFAFGAPTVLVGNIIKMLPASFSTPAAPPNIDALVGIWNDLIKTKINALSALGLGVKYINSNSQFKAIDFAADQQHPNNAGHITIANAFLSKILSIPDLKYSGIAKILPAAAAAPTMSSFSPALGAAGQTVVITGTEFSSATAVLFGVIPATSFIVNSSTQITAVIPANVIAAPLSVQNALGSGSSAAKFYRAVPSVSTPVVDMKGIYGSEMAAVPPTDYLGGKPITVTGTPPTLNTIQFDVSPSLNFATGVIHSTLDAQDLLSVDFEFRAWIRPTKLTSDHEVFVIRESVTPGTIERECALEISSLGAIRFVLQKASVINFDFYSPAGIIAVNSAYRVVASVRGTTATVRVNGSVVSTAAVVGARNQTHTRLLVGAMYDGGGGDRFFVGAIDSVLLLKS